MVNILRFELWLSSVSVLTGIWITLLIKCLKKITSPFF
jgi:hypothetical protein